MEKVEMNPLVTSGYSLLSFARLTLAKGCDLGG